MPMKGSSCAGSEPCRRYARNWLPRLARCMRAMVVMTVCSSWLRLALGSLSDRQRRIVGISLVGRRSEEGIAVGCVERGAHTEALRQIGICKEGAAEHGGVGLALVQHALRAVLGQPAADQVGAAKARAQQR